MPRPWIAAESYPQAAVVGTSLTSLGECEKRVVGFKTVVYRVPSGKGRLSCADGDDVLDELPAFDGTCLVRCSVGQLSTDRTRS